MTREEAIWHANHVFNIVIERCINAQNLKDAREFDEAKQIVIEALEQQTDEIVTLTQLAEMIGMNKTTLKERLNLGWSVNEAVETPIRKRTRGYRPSSGAKMESDGE